MSCCHVTFEWGAAGQQPAGVGFTKLDRRPGSAQRGDEEFTFPKEDNMRAFIADQRTPSPAFPVAQAIYYRHKWFWCLFFFQKTKKAVYAQG